MGKQDFMGRNMRLTLKKVPDRPETKRRMGSLGLLQNTTQHEDTRILIRSRVKILPSVDCCACVVTAWTQPDHPTGVILCVLRLLVLGASRGKGGARGEPSGVVEPHTGLTVSINVGATLPEASAQGCCNEGVNQAFSH